MRSVDANAPAAPIGRREMIKRAGGWVILASAVGGSALVGSSCGRTELGDPLEGIGEVPTTPGTETPPPTTGTATATATATETETPPPTPPPTNACTGMANLPGTATTLTTADIPVGQVRYFSALGVFICRDASGFYAMSSLCTAHGFNLGSTGTWSQSNVSGGFTCSAHQNSVFNGNGVATGGPALTLQPGGGGNLPHKALGVNADDNKIWVDTNQTVAANTRCNP